MFNREPAVIINGLSGLLTQILPLMVVLGYINFDSPEKLAAFISLQGLILTFVSTTLIRSNVVPTAKANAQIQEGIDSPTGTRVETVIKRTEENYQQEQEQQNNGN